MGKISRIVKRGSGDFHQCYRPCRVSEVRGQDEIKEVIRKGLDDVALSRTLLFHGESGVGKTTFGRIVAMGWNCNDGPTSEPCGECESCRLVMNGNSLSFREINAAEFTGIDKIRDLRSDFAAAPWGDNKKRIYLFDESHGLTPAAQNALLKSLEDAREHNQFIFCSTAPDKMIDTLRNRCMEFEFKLLEPIEILELLVDVLRIEEYQTDKQVLEKIVELAKGRPRNALNELQKAIAAGKFEKDPASIEAITQRLEKWYNMVVSSTESEEIHMTKE